MLVRHLTPMFALGALRRGKEIEQFLGPVERGGRRGVRWIALSPGSNGIGVYLQEVGDVPSETFRDITNQLPLDPDDETWGKKITTVANPEEAISLAEREFGATADRWVNQGFVGAEYYDYVTSSRPDRTD
ncbi:hypothetical protein [Actinacidiphila glaucinigra]|uniref:hypothetical protein n=1 Tax=Actinacidiphila glaucinigra TaxID=235986 RepID=UPI0036E132CE